METHLGKSYAEGWKITELRSDVKRGKNRTNASTTARIIKK